MAKNFLYLPDGVCTISVGLFGDEIKEARLYTNADFSRQVPTNRTIT